MSKLATTVLCLCISALLWAQDFEKVGTTGFTFLEIPVSARYLGLGETGITLLDAGSEAVYFNPAAVATQDRRIGVNVAYANWYVGSTQKAAALAWSLGKIGTIGFQARQFDFGEMLKTTNPTVEEVGSYVTLGTYTAGAYAIGLTYARALTDKFSFGATLKYVREQIDVYAADNLVADFGFLYRTGFQSLRIGAFLHNFGLDAKYAEEKFKMPQQLRMGMAAEILGAEQSPTRLTLLVEALHPNDANERLHVGTEAFFAGVGVLRVGYKIGYDDEGLCVGAGLRSRIGGSAFGIDAALLNHSSLNSVVLYTLSMEF